VHTANERLLAGVSARLTLLRRERGLTLTAVAQDIGISLSTLSRLESGHRRATLELLVPLARAYGVTLDELVGLQSSADADLQGQSVRTDDMIAWRLSRSPGQPMALKIVYPATRTTPPDPLPTHEGHQWVYVLAGRLRLIVADLDAVLHQGHCAEIDTRLPHWTGTTGDGPVELLALYGRQGERAHLLTRTSRSG
jgi:transcriptional regulator with XRE-family HTH domain